MILNNNNRFQLIQSDVRVLPSSLKTNFHAGRMMRHSLLESKFLTNNELTVSSKLLLKHLNMKRNMWFSQIRNGFGLRFGQMAIFRVLHQKHRVKR